MRGRLYLLLLKTTQGEQRRVFPIYLITLSIFLMLPFSLFLFPLSYVSYLDLLMRLNPTKNQGSLIWCWRISGLLSMVGYGYVRQLLWEWLLLIVGNCFIMELREITMKNWLVSDNYWNDLLNISSAILFHLIEVTQKITYPPLITPMMYIQLLLAMNFIFPVVFLPPKQSALLPT